MNGLRVGLAISLLTMVTLNAAATTIVSPTAFFNNTLGVWTGNGGANTPDLAIDQSGLSSFFTSGVTDFDAYIGTNPTHTATYPDPTNFWISAAEAPGNSIDFDLGSVATITRFALWQQNRFPDQQPIVFSISTSSVADFSTITNLGDFAVAATSVPFPDPVAAQVFTLGSSSGRYVRLTVESINASTFSDIGELAFGVDSAPVPEPSMFILFGTSVIGLAALRRRVICVARKRCLTARM